MAGRLSGFFSWLFFAIQMIIRAAIVLGAFVIGFSWDLAVALIAALTLVAYVGPTAVTLTLVRFGKAERVPKVLPLLIRVQFVVAALLLIASIRTKLPGLIILCVFCFLFAALYSLMMWSATKSSES